MQMSTPTNKMLRGEIMKYLLLIAALMNTVMVSAAVLETENYLITITRNCAEGEVDCNSVSYNGTNKNDESYINLKGTTWHRYNAEGIPGRFIGYKFKNGNIEYLVTETGELTVIRNETEVLLEESGTWTW